MNSPLLFPSRPLKWAAAFLRVLLWAVATVWLLFALTWGTINLIIVPRIGDLRPTLESLATRAIGIPVRIDRIEARSQGLIPSFELSGVRLLDAQGHDALVLGRVLTAVSVPSLWRLGFEQIHIDRPTLDVRRLADGRLLVAGLDVLSAPARPGETNPAADWLFAQAELVIRSGQVRWRDDQQPGAPPLTLQDVDVVVRNPGHRHLIRLDATAGTDQPGRISLRADMRSPFWSLHPGSFTQWSGTAYAELPSTQLARLASPTHLARLLDLTVTTGQGAMRMWADVRNGQLQGGTADLALTGVQARFARAMQPLELNRFQGRVTLQHQSGGWELGTEQLTLETRSGLRWQQGRLRLLYQPMAGDQPVPGELQASQISLDALRELGAGLPLPAAMQDGLAKLRPQGTIDNLQLNWTGNETGWSRFHAKGKAHGLALAADTVAQPARATAKHGPPTPRRPGFSGAAIEFDLNQQGGQAKVSLSKGHVSFPGVFEEPVIPMDRLSADLAWQLDGLDIQARFGNVRLANADLQGQLSGSWRTSNPASSPSGSRFPGILKLDGSLSRGKGERVHRYLPLVIGADARNYVKAAILAGQVRDVRFKVEGDLWQMPFNDPADGTFHVAAKVSQVDYAYVPPGFMPTGSTPWPALRQAEGELVFDRASMALNISRGSLADAPGLRLTQANARIASLAQGAVVEVEAQLEGPLADALAVVRRSPLAGMTQHALDEAKATGQAAIRFGLNVPLAHTDQTSVKGLVTLMGNDILVTPQSPWLGKARGRVEFSDKGFQISQGSARLAGGELQFSGGMRQQDGENSLQFTGQGQATAEGLRQMPELRELAPVLHRASGSTSYSAQLRLHQGQPALSIQSSLQGLAVALPAPLNKPAEAAWPLRVDQTYPSADTEGLSLTLDAPGGPLLALNLQRPQAAQAPFNRGVVLVGQAAAQAPAPPLPAQGITARVAWPTLDADAWAGVLNPRDTPAAHAQTSPPGGTNLAATDRMPLLPHRLTLEAGQLTLNQRTYHGVALNLNRQDNRWQGQVQARELAGQLHYTTATPAQGAHLVARLARLTLQTEGETPPHALPPGTAAASPAPDHLPSLDVEVQALELDGHALGRLELQAVNRPTDTGLREWRLTQLNLKVPEAQLSATGNWVPLGASAGSAQPSATRRTVLKFKLDVQDSGLLLARFGMPGVFKGGQGQLEGTLGWLGSPDNMDIPSMGGELRLDMAGGQFLKADPGLAKLLGVLSLQSLPRRLALDFRDVFTQGFAFDFVRGDARIRDGMAFTNNLQMKGPNAAVLLEGQADIARETQDIRAVVVPEINAGTASLIATAINPAVGLGSFLAQAILSQPLIQASTQTFRIHGTWSDPLVEKVTSPPHTAPPAQPASTVPR